MPRAAFLAAASAALFVLWPASSHARVKPCAGEIDAIVDAAALAAGLDPRRCWLNRLVGTLHEQGPPKVRAAERFVLVLFDHQWVANSRERC